MKRLTLLALTALMLAPSTSKADSWTKEVTNDAELKAALNAVGAGQAGETYEIICNWDAGTLVNRGKVKMTQTAGKLIIRSNETDFDKMPQLCLAFEWNADAPKAEIGQRTSLIFENLNITGSGSYLVDNRRDLFADTVALRNCDIHGQARSILRFDGDKSGNKLTQSDMSVDVVEVTKCKIHGSAQNSKDNWSAFRLFSPVNNLIITDCMFYDMPYSKSLLETRGVTDVASQVNFSNNMVLLGENKSISSTGFTVLNPGSNMAMGSYFNMHNNIFIGPKEGYTILKNDTSFYSNTKMLSVSDALIMANNNVFDSESYMAIDDLEATLLENNTTFIGKENNTTLENYADFSWETGKTFQDASKNQYYILNSNAWKTAGYDYNESGINYVGPSIAYIDKFPTPASVSVTVNGPSYITYTISPEKDQYYVDDEITITLNDHNSNYRKFNTFNGWSDGATETSRTVKLTGDLNLSASYTADASIISAFDFSEIVKNGNMQSYDADLYFNMDEAYKAVVKGYVNDTTTATGSKVAPFNYIEGNFQTRPAKFGEDEEDMQMPIISRRTAAIAKETQRDYVAVEFSTKDLSKVNFSCFVGTDNNAAKTQALDYSTDNATWTRLAQVDIENGKWSELKGELPEALNNLDKVYVRIIGDLTNGHIINPDPNSGMVDDSGNEDAAAYAAGDAFEYVGNILITADTTEGINNVSNDSKSLNPNAPIYNMMGMKVAKGTKGLLIQNGKKFIVK